MAEWNRCDDCGKYIGFAELESGEARIRMVTPDSEYTRETWETLCSRCLARPNKSFQNDAGAKRWKNRTALNQPGASEFGR